MYPARRSWLLLAGCVFFYVVYLLLGALVFSSMERPVEEKLLRDMETLKQEFLNQSCVDAASLDGFLLKVLKANKYGAPVLGNSSGASNWDLASSMFFANTLVTTVGYGNTTPLSDAGKAFSILYAIIGVPFTMLVLTVCIQRLMYPLVFAPVSLLHRSGLEPRLAAVVHFVLMVVLMLACFFVAPAAVFSTVETSWSFLDGVYFCFMSLCTIGLGDFVPGMRYGQENRPLYQVSVMVYLFVGLMMMYLLLHTFQKMADQHGLTTVLKLSQCKEDVDRDREPIVDEPEDQMPPYLEEKGASEHLDVGSYPSYNTMTTR
ncbi:potassium channel subfamily K member 6 [Brachionichthys hirsutus]|uniref:potassium channel subfamily K member 6 n=1 Tax=Brachionichthys hirsutus TaxID=412623 RepID=UPI0036053EAB